MTKLPKLTVVEIEKGKPQIKKATLGEWTREELEESVRRCNSHDALLAALEKYGCHLPDCARRRKAGSSSAMRDKLNALGCTCGFEQAIAAAKPKIMAEQLIIKAKCQTCTYGNFSRLGASRCTKTNEKITPDHSCKDYKPKPLG